MRGADYLIKRGIFALVTVFVAITINFFLFPPLLARHRGHRPVPGPATPARS